MVEVADSRSSETTFLRLTRSRVHNRELQRRYYLLRESETRMRTKTSNWRKPCKHRPQKTGVHWHESKVNTAAAVMVWI
jgi:hypothetical protein